MSSIKIIAQEDLAVWSKPAYNAAMPIFRGLILILAIWLAFIVARQLYRSHQKKQRLARQAGESQSLSVTVVPCEYCGVHIPKGEATLADGHYFCNNQHRDLKR